MTMTLASSTLQIWRHEYSGDMNIVILVICRCLISCLVAVFVWFILKDQLQSITYSINDLDINVADPKT
ncbi:transmembrane protein, putative [Medicago truncatula]|uniref:Transmembrane protein, putative n=1 Tax=Medicago truncatula TaxID=3880 RepID=G7J5I3_MEDTR|nr:transmembrane protein, putative [Medicago truncatula]